MRQRLLPIWGYFGAANGVLAFLMLKPLTPEERSSQLGKRLIMGKWLYSTFHLDVEEQKHASHTRLFRARMLQRLSQ